MSLSHLPKRTEKPRQNGLTMMMDKGLSNRQMEDFLSTSSHFTDFIKFGFGTSLAVSYTHLTLPTNREV